MAEIQTSSDGSEGGYRRLHSWVRAGVGISLLGLLFILQIYSFTLFHTLIELATVAVAWGAFILLWNGRKYEIQDSFILLGLGLLASGSIDLLHTLAYPGVAAFPGFDPTALSTQFWVGGRLLESLGWLGFAVFLRQEKLLAWGGIILGSLSLLVVVTILVVPVFPDCFVPGSGLTSFKIGMEVGFILMLIGSFLIVRQRQDVLEKSVGLNIQWALVTTAFAEVLFVSYHDSSHVGMVFGHFARLVSRFLVYRALIYLSVARPQQVFFSQLQKEKNRALDSENRYRSLTLNNPDFILELDQDLTITFSNHQLAGLDLRDTLGRPITRFIAPDERARVTQLLNSAMSTGQEVKIKTRDGPGDQSPRYFEAVASPRYDTQGQCLGLILIIRDISLQKSQDKLAKARLRISNFALDHDISALLQKVLDEGEALTWSRIGFFHFMDEDQARIRLQAWSTRTLEEACQARAAGSHYPLSDAGVWADCIRQKKALIHNAYADMPHRTRLPDGHAQLIRELTVPVVRQGKVVAVVGVGNKPNDYDQRDLQLLQELADQAWDIVCRKQAEQELQEAQRRLAQTLANLPGMVFRCANDADWTMKFLSNGCRDLTGYDGLDLVGNRAVSYASLIHPEDREMVWEEVQKALDQEQPYQITYRILPKDQPIKWVWEQGRGTPAESGQFMIEGFIYDISDQVLAQQERQAMEKKVLEGQKLESLGTLAGGIAHDFNNLLQAVLGFTELAQQSLTAQHPSHDHLDRVLEAARKAAGLTNQMLAFSGKGHFTKSRVKLDDQIREMADLCQSTVPRSITLTTDLDIQQAEAEMDINQLQQIVLNLLSNAAEAIGDSPGFIRLSTGVTHCDQQELARNLIHFELRDPHRPRAGPYVFLAVQDSGCGMDPATQNRVFEPFFTTKFTGRGLGLAAVQGIVRGHGGMLQIDSRPDQGTTVKVLFPALNPKAQPSPPAEQRLGSGRGRKRTVLVVDDESDIRALITSQLKNLNLEVLSAVDGQEALDIFQANQHKIGLILLDLVMPRINGRSCLMQLRALDPDVKVIIMSGFPEKEIRDRLAGLAIQGVLPKPFFKDQLAEALEYFSI